MRLRALEPTAPLPRDCAGGGVEARVGAVGDVGLGLVGRVHLDDDVRDGGVALVEQHGRVGRRRVVVPVVRCAEAARGNAAERAVVVDAQLRRSEVLDLDEPRAARQHEPLRARARVQERPAVKPAPIRLPVAAHVAADDPAGREDVVHLGVVLEARGGGVVGARHRVPRHGVTPVDHAAQPIDAHVERRVHVEVPPKARVVDEHIVRVVGDGHRLGGHEPSGYVLPKRRDGLLVDEMRVLLPVDMVADHVGGVGLQQVDGRLLVEIGVDVRGDAVAQLAPVLEPATKYVGHERVPKLRAVFKVGEGAAVLEDDVFLDERVRGAVHDERLVHRVGDGDALERAATRADVVQVVAVRANEQPPTPLHRVVHHRHARSRADGLGLDALPAELLGRCLVDTDAGAAAPGARVPVRRGARMPIAREADRALEVHHLSK
eukprot:scaffold38150_cov65-Phaeocystis_antarctica.AAC.11